MKLKTKGQHHRLYTPEMVEYIKSNRQGLHFDELADKVNAEFNMKLKESQLRSFCNRMHLGNGIETKFQKGYVPPNKGKHIETRGRMAETQFKKGHTPSNKMDIGALVKKTGGYWQRKTTEHRWEMEHILIWTAAHGPVPEGYVLTFVDGDKDNLSLDNLALVSRQTNGVLNKFGLRSPSPELTRSGILVAELIQTTAKAKKEAKREKVHTGSSSDKGA